MNDDRDTATPLAALVHKAQPMARRIVLAGLADLDGMSHTRDMLPARIEELTGHDGPTVADQEFHKLEEYGQGAYALGLAVGLLIHPDVFGKGGRR